LYFNNLDWFIIGFYAIGLIILATYFSRTPKGKERSAEDYFLAGRSLVHL
jgi:SSS family solute:Na+ symporter